MIRRFNRRQVLKHSTAGVGAIAGTRALARAGVIAAGTTASTVGGALVAGATNPDNLPTPFSQPLTQPPVITDAEVELVAQAVDVPLLKGQPTAMWTFNGTWPGPTIRRPAGQTTNVTVRNELPADVGSITVHHHGGHQASVHDGGPLESQGPIRNGESRTYTYELVEDGEGERAATQWYHDHTHFRTGQHNWFGLQGMFIIDDEFEEALNLPTGDQDLVLMCSNREFDENNQLLDRFTAPTREETDAVTANTGGGYPPGDEAASAGRDFFVNGVYQPYADVQGRRHRLRLMNASNWQVYQFHLETSDGTKLPLVQVAAEAGLLPNAVGREQIVLGPAERVEVIVDFADHVGQTISLWSQSGVEPQAVHDDLIAEVAATAGTTAPSRPGALRNDATGGEFVRFNVGQVDPDDPDTTAVITAGQALRPNPEWETALTTEPNRVWVFGQGYDDAGRPAWTINGHPFDHERVDAQPVLDTTETWLITNTTRQSHYIHLHDVDWVVLQRNHHEPPEHERGLKETFRIDPGEVLLIGTKFTDHTGPYMMHCHMLEHEDHGMMTTWEVVESGGDDGVAPAPLDVVLERDMADAVSADIAREVITAAKDGQPAPLALIEELNAGLGPVTGLPANALLYCSLNDIN